MVNIGGRLDIEKSLSAQRRGNPRETTVGVVDIGSNTVHLLVGRSNGRHITPVLEESENLRLGADVDSTGSIGPARLADLIATIERFREIARKQAGLSRLHLMATYAVRAAENGDDVCTAIEDATGMGVEVLAPEQEAELSFLGADAACPSIGPQVVVDIGGGSLQIGIGQHGELWDSVSLPLGASRLIARFVPSDPATLLEEERLVEYLARIVPVALPLPDTSVTGVLGVGGTLRRTPQLLKLKPGDILPQDSIERMLGLVRGRRSAKVGAAYGLAADRARMFLPAMLALREVAHGYDDPPLIMSPFGVREGAILYLARQGWDAELSPPDQRLLRRPA